MLMAGVIDDQKEALKEIMRAANLPVSVIIVKIGKVSEENDSTILLTNSLKVFNQCERKFIDIINYDHFKNKVGHST